VRIVSWTGRFVLATLFGLVLAGIVHLVAVLAIPWLSEQDAFSRLRGTLAADRSQVVATSGGESWLPRPDPAALLGACAYNLDEGPLRVSARTGAMFESLSFHARGSGAFFALTDRAAVRGLLDLVVLTRRQLDEVQAAEDEDEPSRDVRIVAPRSEGLVTVRVVASFPSQRKEAEAAAKSVSCVTEPVPRGR
jgi:uncharacterized membrane protein